MCHKVWCNFNFSFFKIEVRKYATNYSKNQAALLHNQINKEHIVVIIANTVIDPRAMVVVSVDAEVADNAVPRSASSDNFTIWTKRMSIKCLK